MADPTAISFINHANNTSAFIDAIEKGVPFEINGTEARKAVALVLDMYSSADRKRIIKM